MPLCVYQGLSINNCRRQGIEELEHEVEQRGSVQHVEDLVHFPEIWKWGSSQKPCV